MDIAIIPDSHVKPGCGFKRFEWLGNLLADKQPGIIIHMGDLYDMPSLCSHDQHKGSFYERRYNNDIDIGHDALRLLDNTIEREAPSRYAPEKWLLGGNHDEARIRRTLEEDPRLKGTIGVEDLYHDGWRWQPFLKPLNKRGIFFSHYFISGVMGRPVGGKHPARTLLDTNMVSCVAAHSHLFDYSERTRADGRKICGLVGGCFLEPGQREAYAGPAQGLWRNGITLLNEAHDGIFDVEFWSIERLKKEYS